MRSSTSSDDGSAAADAAYRSDAERMRWERDQALSRAARLEHRRGRPAVAAIGATLVVTALLSLGLLVLALSHGSFAAGGAEIDRQVASATAPARDLAADAAERSGEALRRAGEDLKAEGRELHPSEG
jgi:hypothetical protein